MPAVREASFGDMAVCADIFNDWVDETPWMPRVHSRTDVTGYYEDIVFKQQQVWVVDVEGSNFGFLSATDDFVTALYLHRDARGRGFGKMLLDHVKLNGSAKLSLWAFEANTKAPAFYRREGFVEVRRTTGENEEGLPDILFCWAKPEVAV